jgi:hypothetical protein
MKITADLNTDPNDLLKQRLANWSAKLRERGLGDMAALLLDVAEPFGPLGAQALWIAQPALSLFLPRQDIGEFAGLLDDPDSMAWWRSELVGNSDEEPAMESTGDGR